mgnify:CR=1 FL=1
MSFINEIKKEVGKKIFDNQENAYSLMIPSFVFKDRRLKVLEVLVEYLKEDCNLSYHEIASLLNRDDRTIWTVYQRALKKRKNEGL